MLVIKIGGSLGTDFAAVCADVRSLVQAGQPLVIVHGGSAETNATAEKLGSPPRFIANEHGFTSRYTDRAALEIYAMVVNGRVNTLVVEGLQAAGVNAFGVSGVDGRLLLARRKEAIRIVENGRRLMLRDDHSGRIEAVNAGLLHLLLQAGLTPVVAPLALSPEGETLNVDADRAAAAIAAALHAEQLILLTNVAGLMRLFPDEKTLIAKLDKSELPQAMAYAAGRMKKKVQGAGEALAGGVPRVVFADGRLPSPVSAALAGQGTVIQ